jgi:predicted helicase
MTNCLADLHLNGDSQCFPLYWYEERKDAQLDMFDTNQDKYIRHDGITDWILKEVRSRYGNTRAITKEHIFYYVYGILHSQQYRERFADDLKKSLPRIPIVEKVEDFMAFYKAGKELAELHLNYEDCINQCWKEGGDECYSLASHKAYQNANVQVTGDHDIFKQGTATDNFEKDDFEYFSVDKMRFAKVRNEEGKLVPDKSKILFNEVITIEHIPAKAYEYIVNGKSAIEWIMERYAVTVDKNSLIKNDPNDWSKEHNQPRYILDLLLSVISLSCQTVDIVNALPQLNL